MQQYCILSDCHYHNSTHYIMQHYVIYPMQQYCILSDCHYHNSTDYIMQHYVIYSISYSHFVPLCRTSDSSAPKIPRSCQPAFYRCSISTGQQYIEYSTDGSFCIGLPVLFSEVQSTHLFKTMGYRFKPHKPDQPGFFHGLIDRLIDSSCSELSLAFDERGSCAFDLSQIGDDDNHHEGSRSRMTATSLLTKVHFTLF